MRGIMCCNVQKMHFKNQTTSEMDLLSIYIATCNFATLLALLDLCHLKRSLADIQVEDEFDQLLFEATSRCTVHHNDSPKRAGIIDIQKASYGRLCARSFVLPSETAQRRKYGFVQRAVGRSVGGVTAIGVFVRKLRLQRSGGRGSASLI